MERSALLSFSELLDSQLDDSLPYPTLKQLLRSLKRFHPAYPCANPTAARLCSLSQTQTVDAHVDAPPHRSPSGRLDNAQKARSRPVLSDIRNLSPTKRHRSDTPVVEQASALKRRKRHSRRAKLVIATPSHQSHHSAIVDKENVHQAAGLSSNCMFSTVAKPNLVSTNVGEHINSTICHLTRQAHDGDNITWRDLRNALLTQSSEYTHFCAALDELFVATDPVASCTSPQNSQSSKASRSCIFYSIAFWDELWNDYVQARNKTNHTATTT